MAKVTPGEAFWYSIRSFLLFWIMIAILLGFALLSTIIWKDQVIGLLVAYGFVIVPLCIYWSWLAFRESWRDQERK